MENFTKAQVFQLLKEKIVDSMDIPEGKISSDSILGDNLGFDSLDILEIVFDMEKSLGVCILDAETEEVNTFGDLYELCVKKLSEQGRIVG